MVKLVMKNLQHNSYLLQELDRLLKIISVIYHLEAIICFKDTQNQRLINSRRYI